MFCLKTLFFLQCLLLAAWGQTAHRVDDDDAQITYTPLASWHRNEEANPHDEGGFHMVTDDPTATATFRFTGTGIAFSSPLWADSITAAVALDGGAAETVDLSDPASTPQGGGPSTQDSAIRWQRLDLQNAQHTLVVSVPTGLTFAVVDLLVYYTDDSTTTSTTSSTSHTSQTSSSTTTTRSTSTDAAGADGDLATVTSSTKTGMMIAIGVVCGLAGLLAILGLLYWLRRRSHKKAEERAWMLANQEPPAPPPMEEVNDGITAGKGKRFKSVPSRRNLNGSGSDLGTYDTEQAIAAYRSRQSQLVPTPSSGRVSGLRNVVMTGAEQPPLPNSGYTSRGHARTPSDVYSHSSASPDQRKFTLNPHSEPASNAPSFRT